MIRPSTTVVIADVLGAEVAAPVLSSIAESGRRSLLLQTDVSDERQVRAMVEAALAEFGQIDIVMHVNSVPAATGGPRQDDATPAWAQPESEGRLLDRVSSAWSARRAARNIVSDADSAGVTKKAD